MRSIFLLGGFCGFSLVALVGVLSERSGDRILLDAAVGALVSGFLFKWFWERMVSSFTEAVRAKRAERAAADEAAAANQAASNSVKTK